MAKTEAALESPLVTVEVVLLTPGERDLLVYLRKRHEEPQKGRLCLPGSPVRPGETTEAAAQRVLETRTDLDNVYLQQLYTFSSGARDPRGPNLSVAYFALFPTLHQRPNVAPLEDAWLPLREATRTDLAFNHAAILEATLRRLQGRLNYTPDAYYLLPESFTIPQLQRVHELVLGADLKPDVFNKRVRDDMHRFATRETAPSNGAGRPARLYRNPVLSPARAANGSSRRGRSA